MLRIRLTRTGRKHQPSYRIIVKEQRDKRDGEYMALLGHYLPLTNPKTFKIDMNAYNDWLKKGAQPSETVAALVKKFAQAS